MTLKTASLVGESSTTTGTGTYSLGGALTGLRTFVGAGLATFKTLYLATMGSDFEAGIGLVTDASPDTLSRLTILESSNGGAAVNWGAGTKEIRCQLPGRWFPYPIGSVIDFPGSSAPDLHLAAFGQAVSRATYHLLFDEYGTTYGAGDGSTTFGLPDLRGRVVAGKDDMGGSSANRLTNQSGGLNGDILGTTGGAEVHTLAAAEIPDNATNATAGSGGVRATNAHTGSAANAHNNVQPTIIFNKFIFAGA